MKPLQRRPGSRLVWLFAGLLAFAAYVEISALVFGAPPLGLFGAETATQLWRALLVALVTLSLLDALAISRLPLPDVKRSLPRSLALHDWAEVRFEFVGSAQLPGEALLFDDLPAGAEWEGLPIAVELDGDQAFRTHYRLRPTARGDARFGRPLLVAYSPLRLWRFTVQCGEAESVRVYPNFSAVARYGALAMDQHTAQVGIRLRQRRGEGLEFHELREYREGDSSRQVDWKATSRKQTLISREFQDERDQRVIFLLDCGRRMRAKDDDLSHFDHALNAMVLLSHVALRAGDAVGLLSFGEQSRWFPARKGVGTVNRILNATYDLESSTLASDFSEAAEELSRRQSRRSLVVLLTNVWPEDIDDLLTGVGLLRRRHLVLVANLREAKVDQVAGEPVDGFSAALQALGAWQHRLDRKTVHDRLHARGVLTLDATPGELLAQLINRYYAIKRAGVL
ncbi:MAG: DUF58 domain-containing protein [bacterium]|nr:DUF58 domain-containing protein [bacterium]MCP5044535.1 DUF58 domain-containing protein [bacterium]